jgi:hypothetical protein
MNATGGMGGPAARTEMQIDGGNLGGTQWTTWANNSDINLITLTIQRGSAESADVANSRGSYQIQNSEINLINQASDMARSKGIPFVLILNMGTWVKLSEIEDRCDAIIMMWEQGFAGGKPAVKVLYGDVNPSGKTPTSVPIDVTGNNSRGQKLNPSDTGWATAAGTPVYYYEDVFLGYRYFDSFNVQPSYPFGHGLSYTTFEYSNASLSKATFNGVNDKISASVTIKNTGDTAGKEVVQFYVGAPGVQMLKPVKELKEYAKTRLLGPGDSQTITVELDARALDSYSNSGSTDGQWLVEPGHYVVYFASSSADIRATKAFTVPVGFTTENCDPTAMLQRGANNTTLNNGLYKPDQIIATFKPLAGSSFQKAYTVMGAAYGYIPEVTNPDYAWFIFDEEAGTYTPVDASTLVTAGDKVIVEALAKNEDLKLSKSSGDIIASTTYLNQSGSARTCVVLIAQYDEKGRLLTVNTSVPVFAPANIAVQNSLSVTPLEEAVTIIAYLWDGTTYEPLCNSVSKPAEEPIIVPDLPGHHLVPAEGSQKIYIDQRVGGVGGSFTASGVVAPDTGHQYLSSFNNNNTYYTAYQLYFEEAGTYSISFRYGNSGAVNNQVTLRLDGVTVVSGMNWPTSGGWTTWVDSAPLATFTVPERGGYEFRIMPGSTSINFMNYTLTKVS